MSWAGNAKSKTLLAEEECGFVETMLVVVVVVVVCVAAGVGGGVTFQHQNALPSKELYAK